MMTKKVLNVKGLRCPIPVLKAEKALKNLKTGDILLVLTTDPQAIKDFKAFCEVSNCLFQSFNKTKNVIEISICKSL
ncbi:MAG: hypothetical protein CMI97_04545 [Pelagibacteraceae bacterium]|nr:hypothetical protein [Pelagibacteraceae bacterium]